MIGSGYLVARFDDSRAMVMFCAHQGEKYGHHPDETQMTCEAIEADSRYIHKRHGNGVDDFEFYGLVNDI